MDVGIIYLNIMVEDSGYLTVCIAFTKTELAVTNIIMKTSNRNLHHSLTGQRSYK